MTGTCLAALMCVSANGSARAQEPTASMPLWGAHADIVGRTAREHSAAGVEFFVPLLQDQDSMIFIDAGINGDFDSEVYGTFGVGYRAIVTPDLILGGIVALDVTQTDDGNTFGAVSLGAEAIGTAAEARINVQLPFSGAERISDESVAISQPGTLTLLDNQLVEQVTSRRITVDEVPLTGIEGEVGVNLPIGFDQLDDELKVFAGAYHYDGDDVDSFTGVSGRLEYSVRDVMGESLPGADLILSAGLTHDEEHGTNFAGEMRLRIPLGVPARTDADARVLSPIEKRMTQHVVRTTRIHTSERTRSAMTGSLEARVATDPLTGLPLDSIYFADGAETVGAGSPTDPTTLEDAVQRAGVNGTIVAEGNNGTIDTPGVTLANGQRLVGGGVVVPVRLADGTITSFQLGQTAPTIVGIPTANVLSLAADNQLQALTISGGLNGIAGTNVGALTLQQVTIAGSAGAGFSIANNAGTNTLAITGLSVSGTGGPGIAVNGLGGGTTVVTSFGGVGVASAGGGGVLFDGVTFDADLKTAGIQRVEAGNLTIGDQADPAAILGDGLRLNQVAGDLDFASLRIANANGAGLFIRDRGGAGGDFSFGNDSGAITTVGGTAIDIDPVALAARFGTVSSTNAAGQGSGGTEGLFLDNIIARDAGTPALVIDSLLISGAAGDGLVATNNAGNLVFGTTTIADVGGDGIRAENNLGSLTFGVTSVTNAAGDGIDLLGNTGPIAIGTTTIADAGGTGIRLADNAGSVSFADTAITDPGLDGIDIAGINGSVRFGNVDITGLGTGTGVDLTDEAGFASTRVALAFQTLDITGTGAAGSVGIDYSGSTNSFDVTTGESGVISGVAVGIDLRNAAASGLFQYGDGSATDPDGRASVIDAARPLEIAGLNGSIGVYNLRDVAFVGDFSDLMGIKVFYVDADGSNNTGLVDGSANDPGTLAQAIASGADVFALVDNQIAGQDVIDAGAAIQGAPGSVTLASGQRVVSFLSGDLIDLGGGRAPANLLVTGIDANIVRNPNAGSGAPRLTTTEGGRNTLVLDSDNALLGTVIDNGAGAIAVFGNGIGGVSVQSSQVTSIALTAATGTGRIENSTIGQLVLTGGTVAVTGVNADIAHSGAGAALSVTAGHSGSLSFDAASSIDATGGTGLRFVGVSGAYALGGPVILAGGAALAVSGSAGSLSFGNVAIAAPAGNGIDVSGTNGAISLGDVGITGVAAGAVALDFNGAVLTGAFTARSLVATGAGSTPPAGSIGIDLRGVSGGQSIRIGVSPAPDPAVDTPSSLTNFATGVFVDASSNAAFTFGDGEDTVDRASRIIATTGINASSAPTLGNYNFFDVDFLGAAPGAGFDPASVYYFSETGTGTGATQFDPGSVGGAEASGADVLVPIGPASIDAANGGGLGSLDLAASQQLRGFQTANGTLGVGFTAPATIQISALSATIDNLTGSASPTLTTTTAGANVVNLSSGNQLSSISTTGGVSGIAGSSVAGLTADTIRIANTTGAGIALTGTSGTIAFTGSTSVTATGGAGVSIAAGSGTVNFATLSVDNAATAGGGVSISGPGSFSFTNGLTIRTTTGAGFVASGGGSLAVTATAGAETIATTSGTALGLDGVTIGAGGLNLDTLFADGAATGIALADVGSGGAISLGTVTLSGMTARGVDVAGTIGAGLTFGSLSIGLAGGTGTGFDLAGATLGAAITAGDFDVANAGARGTTIGVDLTDVAGGQSVRLGDANAAGQSSSIAGVATGVVISNASSAQFTFGDGEAATDRGSTIDATTRIAAPGSVPAGASFNFRDLVLDGSPGSGFGVGRIFFVDSDGAIGGGDGTGRDGANPADLAFAEANAIAGDLIVLVDNGAVISAAGSGTDDTLVLLADQQVRGFGNGAVAIGFTAATGIDFAGNTFVLTDPGSGAATLTSASGADVVTLGASGNRIDGFILDGSPAGAARGITGAGASGTTIANMTVRNFGVQAINLPAATDTTLSSIDFSGNAVDLVIGGADTTLTDVTSTGTSAGTAIQFLNATGTTTLTNVAVAGAANGVMRFDDASGTVTATNVDLAGTAALVVAGGNAAFDFDAASSIANSGGLAVSLSGRTGGSFTHAGTVTSDGPGAGGIAITGALAANTVTFSGTVDLGGTTALGASGVSIDNAGTASVVTFANLGVATDGVTALSAGNGGAMNVSAGSPSALGATAVSLNGIVAGITLSATQSTGGANNVALTNVGGSVALGTGALSGATGTAFAITGGTANVSYAGSVSKSAAGQIIAIDGHATGTIGFSGAIQASGLSGGILIQNTTGSTASFTGAVTLSTGASNGVTLANNTGSVAFNGGLAITTTSGTGFAASGGGTISLAATAGTESITAQTGRILDLNGVAIGTGVSFDSLSATGTVPGDAISLTGVTGGGFSGGTVSIAGTSGGGSDGIAITGATADIGFGATVIGATAGNGITLAGNAGTVTFTGTTTLINPGAAAVAVTGTNGAIGFDSLQIALESDNTTGVDLGGANLDAGFTTTDFDLTSTSPIGTTAIDLSATTSTGIVRFGDTNGAGQSATIGGAGANAAGPTTGLQLAGANIANFFFGDGESSVDQGSRITATNRLDASPGPAGGSYNILDVDFLGAAPGPGFVPATAYYFSATGTGTGSTIGDPGSIAGAQASNAELLIPVGAATIDAASAGGSLALDANQQLRAFDAPNGTLDIGFAYAGAGVIQTTATAGNITDTAGDGSPVLTTTVAAPVITLSDGNTLSRIRIDGGSVGVTSTVAINGLIADDLTVTNTSGAGISLTGASGSVSFGGSTSITDSGGDGLAIANSPATISIGELIVSGSAGNGINLVGANGNVTIVNAVVDGSTNAGIRVSGATNDVTIFGTIGGTTVNGGAGILVENTVAGSTVAFGLMDVTAGGGDAYTFANNAGDVVVSAGSLVTQNGTGDGVDISGGTGTVCFGSDIDHSGAGGAAVRISGTAGSVEICGDSITKSGGGVLLDIANASGGVDFGSIAFPLTLTASGAGGIRIENSSVSFQGPVALTTGAADAVTLISNAGHTIDFLDGLVIDTTSGDGFTASGGGTVTVGATGGVSTITTTTGQALGLDGVSIGADGFTFDAVSVDGAAIGIDLTNVGSAGGGIDLGTVSLSGITARGVDVSGTLGAGLDFASLAISLAGGTGTAFDLNGATLGAAITAGDFDVTNTGARGTTIGVDLTGVAGNQIVRLGDNDPGGASSSIAGVDTGVVISNASSAQFTYGDGESSDRGSTIEATVDIAAPGTVLAGASFNFEDLLLDGSPGSGFGVGRIFYVDSDGAATGGGDGTGRDGANMATLGYAEANAAIGDIIVLVDNGQAISAFATGADNTLLLLNNQQVLGFANGPVSIGFTAPTGIDFGSSVFSLSDPGSGAATLTSGTGDDVITLGASGNLIDGFILDGSPAGAARGIIGVAAADLTISNMTIGNFTGPALELTNLTGITTLTNVSVASGAGGAMLFQNAAGTVNAGNVDLNGASLLAVTGGNAVFNFDGSSSITNTGGVAVSLSGRTGGSFTFAGTVTSNGAGVGGILVSNALDATTTFSNAVTLSTGASNAVELTGIGSTSFLGGLDITTTSGAGFTASGGATINVAAAGTRQITTTTGQILSLNNVVIGAGGASFGNLSATGSVAATAIDLIGVSGGGVSGGTVSIAGTSGGGSDGMAITNASAAFSFGAVTIDNTGNRGIALIGGNGDVTFASIDIDGTGGRGVVIDGATNDVTINGGSIGATNPLASISVFIDNQVASSTISVSDLDITGNATSLDLFSVMRSAGTISVTGGTFTQASADDTVDIFDSSATITIGADLVHTGSGAAGSGAVEIGSTSGAIVFGGTITNSGGGRAFDIGTSGAITGGSITFDGAISDTGSSGIRVQNLAAGAAVSVNAALTVTNATTDALSFTDNAGALSFAGVTASTTGTGSGIAISDSAGSATYSFGGQVTLNQTGSSGNGVSITGAATHTVSFLGGLSINAATGAGFTASGGATINVAAAGTRQITTTTGQILSLDGVAIGTGASFGNLTATGAVGADAISLVNVSGGSLAGGTVSIAGTSGAGSDGISITGSAANIGFGATTIGATASNGIRLTGNGGTVSFGATSITNPASAGVDIEGSNGAISFADLDINLGTASTTGLDLSNATLTGDITATDFDVTSTTAVGTLGANFAGTTRTAMQVVRLGDTLSPAGTGASASISGVARGVQFSSASNFALVYGDGEGAVDIGSSISASGEVISDDGTGLPVNGSYNFLDAVLTGDTANLASSITYYYVDADGTGDGSRLNPGNVAGALASTAQVIVLVDNNNVGADSIDIAAAIQGSGTTLTLDNAQALVSFRDGTVDLADLGFTPGGAPASFQLTGIPTGGTILSDPTGFGAPTLTTAAAAPTVTLASSNGISGVVVENGGGAAGISGTNIAALILQDSTVRGGTAASGVALASNAVTSLALSNLTLRSGTGTPALSIDGTGGTTTITRFADLVVEGGAGTGSGIAVTDATFDSDTSTAGYQSVAGGDTTIGTSGARVNGNGLAFTDVLGLLDYGAIAIANDGGTGLRVLNPKPNDFTLNNTGGAVDTTNGTAISLDPLTVGMTFASVTATGGLSGIIFDDVAGSFTVTGATTITGTTGYGINATLGNTGTFNFDTVSINNTGSSGSGLRIDSGTIAVSGATSIQTAGGFGLVQTGGAISIDGALSISTGTGQGIAASAGTITATNAANTVASTGAAAVAMTNNTANLVFANTSSSASPQFNIVLQNVAGTIDLGTGTLAGAINTAVRVIGGTAVISYAGAINNTVGQAVEISGRTAASGPITLSGTISHNVAGARGIYVHDNTGGTVTFSGTSQSITTGSANGVELSTNAGATVNFTGAGLTIGSATGTGFAATGGGTLGVAAGTIATTGTGTALNLDGVTVAGGGFNLSSVTANGAANGVLLANVASTGGGTVALGTVNLQNVTTRGVDISGTVGAAMSFANLDISLGNSAAIAFDLNGASVGAAVTANDFDVINNAAAGTSIGVDLRGALGGSVVRLGDAAVAGASSSIAGVNTGVFLDGATNLAFTYGDGEVVTDQASTLSAVVGIDASAAPVAGTYNFRDVTFAASPGLGFGVGDIYFVDSDGAGGGGTGTGIDGTNPTTLAAAELASGAGDVIVLISNGSAITAAGTNADNTLVLADGEQVRGFGGGAINLALTVPGTILLANNSISIADPTGNGAATLTTSVGADVITLGSQNNIIAGFILDGDPAGAARGINDNGGGATNTLVNTMTIRNFDTVGIEITPSTNTTITNTTFTGNVSDMLLNAAGTTITDVTSTGATGTAFQLNNVTGTTALTNVSITGALGGGLAFSGTHAGTITATNVDVSAVNALNITGGAGTFTFDGTSSIANASGAAVTIANRTGGAITFGGTVVANGATNGIVVSGATGANAVSFTGTVDLGVGTALTSTAVSLANVNTTTSFADIDIVTSSASGFVASGGGTVNVTTGTLNSASASAINLNGIAAGINFLSTTSSGGTNNATLAGVTGTVNLGSAGAFSAASGASFLASGGSANVTYGGTITKTSAGRLIDIQNRTAGTVTLSGNLSATGSATGIFANANTGGTVTFSGASKTLNTGTNAAVNLTNNGGTTFNFTGGGLGITTTSAAGFNATGGGTVTVQGTGNAISSGPGVALNVVNTNIGLANLTFQSISASGGANGIVLNNTGTTAGVHGGLVVTGTGTADASGGVIQSISNRGITISGARAISLSNMVLNNANTVDGTSLDLDISAANAAIYLSGVTGVALSNVDISGTADNGITGLNVSDFTMTNSSITQAGNSTNESGIEFSNLSGTSSISNTTITFSETNSLDIVNTDVNLNLTLDNVTFSDTQTVSSGGAANGNGEGALQFRSFSSAGGAPVTDINILNSDFLRLRTQAIQVIGEDDSIVNVDITGSTIDSEADIGTGVDINGNDTSNVTFNVIGNTIQSRNGSAVNITSFLDANVMGRINDNVITVNGIGSGTRTVAQEASNMVVEIRNNAITMGPANSSSSIDAQARIDTARLDLTIGGNSINSDTTAVADINITSGSSTAGESNQVYVNIINNGVVAGGPNNVLRLRVSDVSNTNRLFLQGFVEAGAGLDDDAVATWNANGNTPTVTAANINVSLTGTAVAPLAGITLTPTNPLP